MLWKPRLDSAKGVCMRERGKRERKNNKERERLERDLILAPGVSECGV